MKRIFISILFWCPLALSGSNQWISYQGRITRPDGTYPDATVSFSLSLYSPAPGRCLLYSETQSADMTGQQGFFSLQIGSGTRNDGGTHSLAQVFANSASLTGLTCASGTSYTPQPSDDRDLVVSFNDAGHALTFAPIPIKAVPYALQAKEVDGFGIDKLVKVGATGNSTTFETSELARVKLLAAASCALNEILKWNGSVWACSTDSVGSTPLGTKGDLLAHNGSATVRVPVGANGQVLTADSSQSSGLKWSTPPTGTVSSVQMALPNEFTVSGGPVVSSGTLSASWSPQNANVVFAGPSSGGAAAPTFRGLASSDLPSFDASKIATGTLSVAQGGTGLSTFTAGDLIYGSAGGSLSKLALGSTGTVLSSNGTNPVWNTPNSLQIFTNGGNSFAGSANLGTTTAHSLNLKTFNQNRLSIDTSGNVDVGVSAPAQLKVRGQMVSQEKIVPTGGSVDFANGNIQILQSVGGSVITLNNMVDGALYMIVVEDTTARTYTFSGCTTVKANPPLSETTGSTIFTILKLSTACYLNWSTNY